ncbi:MAG TPA: cyclic nucleotide-binding domain-containing protein [Gaiellaceae bacterium]|nr:cyclic nucleotide-binding domain-containing protein [Gaiellaceae bacterium]
MKTLDTLLAESPVFAGLDDARLGLVAGCARTTGFEAGDYLFREGAQADTFYLVRQGRVTIEIFVPGRGALAIQTVDPGDVIGWSWLFPPYRWHFDARALDAVRAVAFDGACLRGKCEADHTLGYELLGRFSPLMLERLQATRMQLLDVYGGAA